MVCLGVVGVEGLLTFVHADPPEIYGWRAFVLALSACFGGMLFGMDIGS